MKAIMFSIKPKWVAKMLNGEKTIEIRKNKALYKAIQTIISMYGYVEFYGYCTKDEKNLLHKNCADIYWIEDKDFRNKNKQLGLQTQPILNGKVLFKFRCYKVEEIKTDSMNIFSIPIFYTDCMNYAMLQLRSCLNLAEIDAYLKGKVGYAVHISDLEIFDKPKELSEFRKCYRSKGYPQNQSWQLTKAPQNMCYIETEN